MRFFDRGLLNEDMFRIDIRVLLPFCVTNVASFVCSWVYLVHQVLAVAGVARYPFLAPHRGQLRPRPSHPTDASSECHTMQLLTNPRRSGPCNRAVHAVKATLIQGYPLSHVMEQLRCCEFFLISTRGHH